MNKKIAILSVALAATFPFATTASADDVTTISTNTSGTSIQQVPVGTSDQVNVGWRAQREQNQQERAQLQSQRQQLNQQAQENKQQNVQTRCQNIQNRLNDKITQSQNNQKNFAVAFTDMKARLQRLSDRLAAKNIDVTKLNQDITTLGGKIDKLTQDHDSFLSSLQTSLAQAPDACGTSQGQFMSQVASSRSAAQTVEQDRLDIRSFFQSTIRPDLMTIRTQIANQKTTDTATDSSASATSTTTTSAQ